MRNGAPGRRTLEERLAAKIEVRKESRFVEDECHVWVGSTTSGPRGGYAQIKIGGNKATPTLVHRLLYEREHGAVPPGLQLDHLCEVKACVRPSHLEPVTHQENIRRHYERERSAA